MTNTYQHLALDKLEPDPNVEFGPGARYGRLVVVREEAKAAGVRRWLCRCDCGNTVITRKGSLTSGRTRSCGCFKRDVHRTDEARRRVGEASTVHGHCAGRPSPTYHSWRAMVRRCSDPSHQDFADYGARGIRVCESWLVFENFLAAIGERPTGTTLDRIDGERGYEPGNCRWATEHQQHNNTGPARRIAAVVPEIRRRLALGQSNQVIAAALGIGAGTVSRVRRGVRHAHIQ